VRFSSIGNTASAASMAYRGLGGDSGEYGDWLSRFLNLKNIRTP